MFVPSKLSINTFRKKLQCHIIPEMMSKEKLSELKTKDPFMYYSIRSIRNAALIHQDEEGPVLTSLSEAGNVKVERQTRLTFEYHPDKVLFGGDMLIEGFDADEDCEDDAEDDFYSFLSELKTAAQVSSRPSPIEDDDDFEEVTFIVPTFPKESTKALEVCPSTLSSQDLALLKEQDSFMYYSIPSTRNKATLNSLPVSEMEGSRKIKRQSRISFECHPDLLFEDVTSESSNQDDCDEESDSNFILSLCERLQGSDDSQ
jgi:hypothetical protein